MGDKEPRSLVTLSVRVPAQLKQAIAKAAKQHQCSMGKELEYILSQPANARQLDEFNHTTERIQFGLRRTMVAALENFILQDPAVDPEKLVSQLKNLVPLVKRSLEATATVEVAQHLESTQSRVWREQAEAGFPEFERLPGPVADLVRVKHAEGDLKTRRRKNLLEYLAVQPRGAKSRLAERLRISQARLSHLLSSPDQRGHRTISDALAREIEQALGLPACQLERQRPQDELSPLEFAAASRRQAGGVTGSRPKRARAR